MRSRCSRVGRVAKALALLPFLGAASAAPAIELVTAEAQLRGNNLALGVQPPAGTYTIGAYCDVAGPATVLAANTSVVAQLVARPVGVVAYVPAALSFETGTWPLRPAWAGVGGSRTKPELAPLPADAGTDTVQSSCPGVPEVPRTAVPAWAGSSSSEVRTPCGPTAI